MVMPRKKNKNPPIMSHEFVIQNHADIVSCVAIVIMIGLVFEVTSPLSKLFVFLQYGIKNETEETTDEDVIEQFPHSFNRGWLDGPTVFFQAVIMIVLHAVLQEYAIDKISRKLHLSKTKTSKFNESGQLSVWSAVSAVWAGYCVHQNGFIPNVANLWETYPDSAIPWQDKLFMLVQLAYWLHMFPEFYLQKVRREEIPVRVPYYSLYLFFILAAYFMHFWKLCIFVLMLHYPLECVFHVSRMLYFAEKEDYSQIGFYIWAILYPVARLLILTLTVLVFWFGLGNAENQGLDLTTGNYNSNLIRTASMTGLCLLQFWLMWKFITLQLRRWQTQKQAAQATKKKSVAGRSKGGKKQKKSVDSEEDGQVSNGKLKRS